MASKFKNTKVTLDGLSFMSKAEAAYYYFYLKPEIEEGLIENLELQPRIKCEVNGKKVCDYVSDFSFYREEERFIVEVKGYQTDVYRLKIKLVYACHPDMNIEVVPASKLRSSVKLIESKFE